MRLLTLLQEMKRLDEAAVDRYLEGFTSIFDLLGRIEKEHAYVPKTDILGGHTEEELEQMIAQARQLYLQTARPGRSYNIPTMDLRTMAYELNRAAMHDIEDPVEAQRAEALASELMDIHDDLKGTELRTMASGIQRDPAVGEKAAAVREKTIENVTNAVQLLGRADRISWYLRWSKLNTLQGIYQNFAKEMGDGDRELVQKGVRKVTGQILKAHNKWREEASQQATDYKERANKLRARANTDASADATEAEFLDKRSNLLYELAAMAIDDSDVKAQAKNFGGRPLHNRLQHIMQMSELVRAINELKWTGQTAANLDSLSGYLEEEWRERMGRFIDADEVPEDAEMVIEFPDGSHWIDLNRRECSIEARAMGHCGNVSWGRDGDNVLSYREPAKHPETGAPGWIPRLTFIINDGLLGEMKGYKNQRPPSKYHEKIIPLLMNDMVTGIRGGGHAPENNFSLDHLPEATKEKLIAEKPELGEVHNTLEGNAKIIRDEWAEHNIVTSDMKHAMHNMWEELEQEVGGGSMPEYEGSTSSFVFDLSYTLEEWGEYFGSGGLKRAMEIFTGNAWLGDHGEDFYGDPEDVWNEIGTQELVTIRNWIAENYEADVEEWKEENDRDWEDINRDELWTFVKEASVDEVEDAINSGTYDGAMRGYENTLYEAVQRYFDDMPSNIGDVSMRPGFHDTVDKYQEMTVSDYAVVEVFTDPDELRELMENGPGWKFDVGDFEWPDSDGTVDTEVAVEVAEERLRENGIDV